MPTGHLKRRVIRRKRKVHRTWRAGRRREADLADTHPERTPDLLLPRRLSCSGRCRSCLSWETFCRKTGEQPRKILGLVGIRNGLHPLKRLMLQAWNRQMLRPRTEPYITLQPDPRRP